MKWFAYRNLSWNSLDLLAVDERAGTRAFAQPVQLIFRREETPDGLLEPTLRLPGDAGQSLFQALWDQGFRPSDGDGGSAEASALRKHIAFAERVAFALLDREGGKA